MLIYKLFSEKDYKKFLDESSFEGSASDSEDGFIHLSTRSQIRATVYKHFNDVHVKKKSFSKNVQNQF